MQITIGFDKRQGTVIAGNNVKDVACRGDRAVFGDALKTIMKFLAAVLLADLIASASTHRKKGHLGKLEERSCSLHRVPAPVVMGR